MTELDSISSNSTSSAYDVIDTSISTSEEPIGTTKRWKKKWKKNWKKVKQGSSSAAEKTKQGCGKYWANVLAWLL